MASTGSTCCSPVFPRCESFSIFKWMLLINNESSKQLNTGLSCQEKILLLFICIYMHFNFPGESQMIPEDHSTAIIDHVCMVHSSVDHYSKLFLQKLRRCNYVTPKNYLDFINTYSSLLEDKDEFILGKIFFFFLTKLFTFTFNILLHV